MRDKVRTYRTLYQAEVPGGAEHTPAGYKRWAEYGKSLKGEFTLFKLPTAYHSLDGARLPELLITAKCRTMRRSRTRTRAR